MARIIPNKLAIEKANKEFFKRYPSRKDKPLTQSDQDAKLRAEWLSLFKSYQGKTAKVSPKLNNSTALQSRCSVKNPKELSIFVYLYKARADGFGHIGMVLKQKDGSYIRYSQAPKHFARGSEIVGIPTKYLNKIQIAVNQYISSEDNYYNIITNNCADFVNDSINAADDINVSDETKPIDYYVNLVKKYKGCQIQ